jgi:hypothetical protein
VGRLDWTVHHRRTSRRLFVKTTNRRPPRLARSLRHNSAGDAAAGLFNPRIPMLDSKTTFRDMQGQEWTIEPSFATFARIAKQCRLKISDLSKFGENWGKLVCDDELATNALWSAIEPPAENGTIDGWLSVVNGVVVNDGRRALLCALCQTYPAQAAILSEGANQIEEQYRVACDEAAKTIEALPSDLDQLRAAGERLRAEIRRGR